MGAIEAPVAPSAEVQLDYAHTLGAAAAELIATLRSAPALTAEDILVF